MLSKFFLQIPKYFLFLIWNPFLWDVTIRFSKRASSSDVKTGLGPWVTLFLKLSLSLNWEPKGEPILVYPETLSFLPFTCKQGDCFNSFWFNTSRFPESDYISQLRLFDPHVLPHAPLLFRSAKPQGCYAFLAVDGAFGINSSILIKCLLKSIETDIYIYISLSLSYIYIYTYCK